MTASIRCPELQAVIAAFFSNGINMTREELVTASDALLHAEKCPDCLRVIEVAKKLDNAFDEDPDAVARSIERNTEELLTRLPVHRWPTAAAKPQSEMRTIDSSDLRPVTVDPPPMLTDEAPPIKTVTGLAQADAPPPPTAADEALRASLPFTPAIAMDPIDGSKISIRASIPTVEYKNKLYYFANEDHKRTFVANPEQYTKGLFSHL